MYSLKKVALCALACLVFSASLAWGGNSSKAELDPADFYFAGPHVVTDEFNRFSLDLPEGWFATVPMPVEGTELAVTTISNYDVNKFHELIPGRSTHTMLKSMVKVDVFVRKLAVGETVAEWAAEHAHKLASGTMEGEAEFDFGIPVSRIISYQLAGRIGSAYVLATPANSAVEVVLPWKRDDQMLFMNIHQGDSEALGEALRVLNTVRPKGQPRPPMFKGDARLAVPIMELAADLPSMKSEAVERKGPCTSWTGSDSAYNAYKAPVAYFPFQYGQYWQAGYVGSFYGNFYHGNCNNDYYAVDYNYRGGSSCNSWPGSGGRTLYAVWSGTATTGYDSTGYGNYVRLTSSADSSYEVLYGHLQQTGHSGWATGNITVIGYTGNTGGASSGPHLHLRLHRYNKSRCNYWGGCPNGEGASWPQGYAFKNMWTLNSQYPYSGSSIYDGSCYGGHP